MCLQRDPRELLASYRNDLPDPSHSNECAELTQVITRLGFLMAHDSLVRSESDWV